MKVDQTIDTICDWIQEKLKDGNYSNGPKAYPVSDMVRALAELVSANADKSR